MSHLDDLEYRLCEKLREGRKAGESFRFTLLKALKDIVPAESDYTFLAETYLEFPYTLDQFDEGGSVSHLIRKNIEKYLSEHAKVWKMVVDEREEKDNVIHPTEWR